ncbi:MAG TPA: hypothetical protein VGH38_07935, partial [Bryobacteraceae bacterium]
PKFAIVLFLAAPVFAAEGLPVAANLVVHEWGTFTSVAGEDGNPVPWSPLAGPSDLPCFVVRGAVSKFASGDSLVRMETPVLYFYSPRAMALSVNVDFPQGRITEWYPQASNAGSVSALSSRIEWNQVEVTPGEHPALPAETAASHYYAARNTDAAPIRIGEQQEKMIFYRGVGGFPVPVHPAFASDGSLEIRNTGAEPVPSVILFENRGGKVGYRTIGWLDDTVRLDAPELNGDVARLRRELAATLVEQGLYSKEADAMLETWRDSWFEEGMRVFYFVPRATVDSLLPLQINPAPEGTARVFVGRVEVLSPTIGQTIETALARGDLAALARYGRFLDPFIAELEKHHPLARTGAAQVFLTSRYQAAARESAARSCVR